LNDFDVIKTAGARLPDSYKAAKKAAA